MPIYEYECTSCRHRFERRQRIDEEPVKVCPECQGPTRKVLHPVGVIFKGSGWYITDNRKGGESEPSASSGEAKSESKAETKSEAKESAGSKDGKANGKAESKPAAKPSEKS